MLSSGSSYFMSGKDYCHPSFCRSDIEPGLHIQELQSRPEHSSFNSKAHIWDFFFFIYQLFLSLKHLFSIKDDIAPQGVKIEFPEGSKNSLLLQWFVAFRSIIIYQQVYSITVVLLKFHGRRRLGKTMSKKAV